MAETCFSFKIKLKCKTQRCPEVSLGVTVFKNEKSPNTPILLEKEKPALLGLFLSNTALTCIQNIPQGPDGEGLAPTLALSGSVGYHCSEGGKLASALPLS